MSTPSPFHKQVHQRLREIFGDPDNSLGRDDHWALRPPGPHRAAINVLVNGTAEKPAIWVFDPHAKNDGVMRASISSEDDLMEVVELILARVKKAAQQDGAAG